MESTDLWARVKPGYRGNDYCTKCNKHVPKSEIKLVESGPHIKSMCPRDHFIAFLPQVKDAPEFVSEYEPKHYQMIDGQTYLNLQNRRRINLFSIGSAWWEDQEPDEVFSDEDIERSLQFAAEDYYSDGSPRVLPSP